MADGLPPHRLAELSKDLDEASAVAEVHAGVRLALAAGRTLLAALIEVQKERDEALDNAARLAHEIEVVDAALAEAQRERDEERRKVEALLLGDKALQPRIWLGEEVQRLKAQLAEAQRREELMRPVVEAARLSAAELAPGVRAEADIFTAAERGLVAAVWDTYETQTGGTE